MIFATAFMLGLVGSLHCADMCGPLVIALPAASGPRSRFLLGRILYNTGRIATYGLLGALFGLLGQTLILAGIQRWLSLAAGIVILLGLILSTQRNAAAVSGYFFKRIKPAMSRTLNSRTLSSLFLLGTLNGLLPCGLVYVACAGAVAAGGFLPGIEYMLLFGFGTLPMMLGLTLAGGKLHTLIRLRFQKWIPVAVFLAAALLIVRGLSLGIPYLSPDLTALQGASCH